MLYADVGRFLTNFWSWFFAKFLDEESDVEDKEPAPVQTDGNQMETMDDVGLELDDDDFHPDFDVPFPAPLRQGSSVRTSQRPQSQQQTQWVGESKEDDRPPSGLSYEELVGWHIEKYHKSAQKYAGKYIIIASPQLSTG